MDSSKKIWLSAPHMGGGEEKYIQKAFQDNLISSLGANINGLEEDIENYLKENKKVVVLNSGTSAIHLALLLAGVKEGDEVLCQSFTFVASVNPVLYIGANPIFIDSEISSWNMCPNLLKKAIKERIHKNKKPKAIIVVHLYGMSAKIDEIAAVAQEFGIPLIEDAAEALGSTFNHQKCGTFGDYGVFSFNGNKIITTSGGGALICKTSQEKEKAIFLATQAKEKAPYYQHKTLGYNYRMSNVLAGIGRGQMEVLDQHVHSRRQVNKWYKNIFKDKEGITLQDEPDTRFFSNYWLSTILINSKLAGFSNKDLKNTLATHDIESRFLWKPMHLQPLFSKKISFTNGASEELFNTGLCLPSGSNLTNEQLERIAKAITSMF